MKVARLNSKGEVQQRVFIRYTACVVYCVFCALLGFVSISLSCGKADFSQTDTLCVLAELVGQRVLLALGLMSSSEDAKGPGVCREGGRKAHGMRVGFSALHTAWIHAGRCSRLPPIIIPLALLLKKRNKSLYVVKIPLLRTYSASASVYVR